MLLTRLLLGLLSISIVTKNINSAWLLLISNPNPVSSLFILLQKGSKTTEKHVRVNEKYANFTIKKKRGREIDNRGRMRMMSIVS